MARVGKRRALGQHFLRDHKIISQIVETAMQEATKNGCVALLEVGPGEGAITNPLREALSNQQQIQTYMLAETDEGLIKYWQGESESQIPFPFRVVPGDFVETPEDQWLTKTPLAVASNLPYSAATAIVVRLADKWREIPVMVLMFQAEVARRLRAEPSTKEWGSLSLWIQNRWDVTRLVSVPPRAFVPPPKVDSEVVVLRRRAKPRIELKDQGAEKVWDTLLRVCFAHRRKMLRSGLPPSGPWRNALERSGLDGTKRAESLQWDEWQRLFTAVEAVAADSQ